MLMALAPVLPCLCSWGVRCRRQRLCSSRQALAAQAVVQLQVSMNLGR